MTRKKARTGRWEKRGIFDDPRLSEISRMYEDLGFSVKLIRLDPTLDSACTQCMKKHPDRLRVLYTKRIDPGYKNR